MNSRGDVGAFETLGRAVAHAVRGSGAGCEPPARATAARPGRRAAGVRHAGSPGRFGSACCGLAVALALLVGSSCARADSDAVIAEYRIKAAFLFKFLGFVDWPPASFERADAPFVIGVLGAASLGSELEQIASGRQVNGHPVRVRLLARGDSAAGLQVLFVGRAETARLNTVAMSTDSLPVLVVSESDGALAQGSAINFVVVDDKVRFDVSLHPINRAGLKISARLLAVARVVQSDPS
jgi:hypothetical protein